MLGVVQDFKGNCFNESFWAPPEERRAGFDICRK